MAGFPAKLEIKDIELNGNRILQNGTVIIDSDGTTNDLADGSVTTAKLAADAVTNAKLADTAVSLENLDSGVAPSHVVKFAANYTTTGGAAAEAITVTGALATDIPFVMLQDDGTNNVSVLSAAVTADTLTVTFSGDPSNDTVISYQLLRAAA